MYNTGFSSDKSAQCSFIIMAVYLNIDHVGLVWTATFHWSFHVHIVGTAEDTSILTFEKSRC